MMIGKIVTWPTEPGDWTTCEYPAPKAKTRARPAHKAPQEFWLNGRGCRFPNSYTGLPRWTPPPKAINDNSPQRARPVMHRENDARVAGWLSVRDATGVATEYGQAGSRIERALVKDCNGMVIVLRRVRELLRPPLTAANDNQPTEGDDEGEEVNSGVGLEYIHNQGSMSPSIGAMIAALADGLRPRVVRDTGGSLHRFTGGLRPRYEYDDDGNMIENTGGWRASGSFLEIGGRFVGRFHGLQKQDGVITSVSNSKGNRARLEYRVGSATEVELPADSETARHLAAQPADNASYLRLGAAANDNAVTAAGMAWQYGRLAGIAEAKGVAASAPMHDVMAELDRRDAAVSAGLTAAEVELIDLIYTGASFRSIGLSYGYAQSSAHRMGRKIVVDTLRDIGRRLHIDTSPTRRNTAA